MATHVSRNTTTGQKFEDKIHVGGKGIDLSKENLRTYFKEHIPNVLFSLSYINSCKDDQEKFLRGVPYVVSKALKPDEAYYDPEEKTLTIYEKKAQGTEGSVDEKLQTCAYKINEYRKIAKYLGVPSENVRYIYVLQDWFDPEKNIKYKDTMAYIKSIDGCDYIIIKDE